MKRLSRILFIVCISFFIFNGSVIAQVTDTIIGAFDRSEFLKDSYKEWFVEEYKNYELNFEVLDQIQVTDDLEIIIYLGTWCGDSRREVPRFIKILDFLKYDMEDMNMVGLNRKKKAPEYQDNKWGIEFVPTFIFLKNGKEIGRIIETPELSLEEDFQAILESPK